MAHTLHFVFYANASSNIGAGHIMRLIALAQSCLQHNIKVTFACQQCPDYLRERLSEEGFAYQSLPVDFCLTTVQLLKADVLIIDDYNITDAQWQIFIQTKAFLVNIDDNINQATLHSHLIVNPSSTACAKTYRARTESAQLCLGPDYAMLRQEFAQQAFVELKERSQLLLTLGGADVKNMSLALTEALIKCMPKVHITLLLGGLNNSALHNLTTLAQQFSQLHIIQQSSHVAPFMMQAGLAISAAGGTLNELACMGTPAIALVSVNNQQAALQSKGEGVWYYAHDVREYAAATKLSHNSGLENAKGTHFTNVEIINKITQQASELWRDLCKREYMSKQARQIIDSKGCDRIITCILSST